MRVRVGVNGMGRIGRAVLRAAAVRAEPAFEIVAVNDLAPPATVAHLLRHDSTYGAWGHRVEVSDGFLSVDDHALRATQEADTARLDWAAVGVDLVVEATGRFRDRDAAAGHLAAGARKVLVTAPGRGLDATIVMGVNQDTYDAATHHLVSNASCTTNCAAPMVQVLHQAFGVEHGLLTTVHSYTGDQNLLDAPHNDLRRARSAAVNIIPTGTGAARAIGEVLPELAGRLDGVALRVPVVDASLVDLTVGLSGSVTVGQVNRAFRTAADGPLKNILRCTDEPIVSHDVIGEPASCVIDLGLTQAVGSMVKVFGWYDNEWGYTQRTIDLLDLMARILPGD
ncbi:type I glyceraldehyde-3-phosphate dehydrogenase [Pseudonocardia hydrocarbonoxydans]|uniref:Glyceraldehyde-3-phosphate dehydrogenase n=1 Tax=Pseudonocardia hydrocarbonoxydans TaxID=76726 RepID=A0A4Y3WP36_9PSEU|nr:type I glyceraldehyde-3-phosphate dehydrogenase [Pseudonocardia hydrocarbonoxydans]GEC20031.1 glyceraldehyde-3-phosphate dehydrogenase [Pseudonocardia hydrocarbonoxydans]